MGYSPWGYKELYKSKHMESRKMVLMNLFEGKEGRCRYKEWTCGTIGGENRTDGENSFDIYTLLCVKVIGWCDL